MCNNGFACQRLIFTDDWSAALHRPLGSLQLEPSREGVSRMIIVLGGEARYGGGRPLPRSAVHLYAPDRPFDAILAAGGTQILLLVTDQQPHGCPSDGNRERGRQTGGKPCPPSICRRNPR